MRGTQRIEVEKLRGEKRVFHILPLSIRPTSVVDSAGTFRVLSWISEVVVLILAGRRGKQRYFE